MQLTLTQINIYPIKSLRGVSVESAEVLARGLRHDRRWMLVDENGLFLSQRTVAAMARFEVGLSDDAVVVAHGPRECRIPFSALEPEEAEADRAEVQVWSSQLTAPLMGEEFDAFFTQALGTPCRLVGMRADTRRAVNPEYSEPGDETSFADGFPFLIIGEATLAELNGRLDEPVEMNRFRPNLVFGGGEPGDEDNWDRFTVGGIPFRAVKPCSRCVIVTTDQRTGQRLGPEPLRTLARYRAVEGKVMFGQNLLTRGTGMVGLGAPIEVISRK